MATRSTIAVELADGRVRQVYCHWDGYLDHNGQLLIDLYNGQRMAEALTELGSISSLKERIDPIGKHSWDAPEPGTTIYYCRDRGEPLQVNYFPSVEAYKRDLDGEEYDYLFSNGEWTVRSYRPSTWVPVEKLLEARAAENEAAD